MLFGGICVQMKKINLQTVLTALENNLYEVKLPDKTMVKAKKALAEMLKRAI